MIKFAPVTGVITEISVYEVSDYDKGCFQLITLQTEDKNTVRFVINPLTYIVEEKMLKVGDKVIAYYDANMPVILIYPPQYTAIVIAKINPSEFIKIDYFNEDLISSDGFLKIGLTPLTQIIQENGQPFIKSIENRNLVVIYHSSTKSIPALTYPKKIIVLCRIDLLEIKKPL